MDVVDLHGKEAGARYGSYNLLLVGDERIHKRFHPALFISNLMPS